MTRRMRRMMMLLAVLAAAVLGSVRAAAQAGDPPSPDLLRLRRACAGSMARVATVAGDTVRGRCGPVEDARLVVQDTAGRVWEMPYGTVKRVHVRRSGASRGAKAGAVVGGIVGGAWVGLIVDVVCNGDGGSGCGDDVVLGTLLGAGAGALGGAGVGAALGSVTRVWVRVYP